MTFYGDGIVWDCEKNKPLCKFENGELETADKRVVEILKGLGYKFDEVVEVVKATFKGGAKK